MLDYSYLLSISIILISTKFLGSITEKINLPQVVGALVAGILIGPAVFNIVHDTSFLDSVSQIGVIILMFMAGLDTDMGQLKRKGLSYLLIALFGVIIPLIGGSIAYMWFFHLNPGNQQDLLMAIFIGVILTATSVSITIEALKELGYANSSIGNAILGAAIVDDIIGIIVLSIICSFKDSNIHVSTVIIKIVIYFICMFILSLITVFGARFLDFKEDKRRISVYVLAFVFFVAYISEKYVGIADITGAYLVGMICSKFSIRNEIIKKTNVMSYLFFSPIFFASIGLKTELGNFTKELVIFSMILLVVAIITKILGAGLGARICGYDRFESLNIGIGMVSRGEVALIVAQKGFHLGLIDKHMFSPIILVVVVTTIVTPILLKKTLYLKKTQNS
ncbi:cation:proton antiporter [Peptostreptococcus anaerobius]|uniref:cation:proton antiporter n=1 Tax=Peptostreptococcus anaerobius TaxID=1261 RepID=UPI001D08E4EC|nr:cation:proton antiporter [Peptostreptococcus anaerobius]MCB6982089.1 cation:proton antiporter [Peptostreptococcus anaerobius]MCQ5149914.1 cation:proton antiporter [Peptostreptococcus anaerobius]MDU0963723.1 cation:proton antiporter [Peptostreptococcus anaerobius]MDU0997701.1 cation:proton antiporter [Peptostreptococcus anaerobius]MDU1175640.1 cation:proton antiporter [Peptostreptococcus anaerobius]